MVAERKQQRRGLLKFKAARQGRREVDASMVMRVGSLVRTEKLTAVMISGIDYGQLGDLGFELGQRTLNWVNWYWVDGCYGLKWQRRCRQ
ncbi:hypothetical protein M0R45_026036 [Rubus argutus]|uniref:Uncharacterized protein n=1 Tax=Rubus argutus TaxID=59490 RepID=A0AAW1WWE0_RUBAR